VAGRTARVAVVLQLVIASCGTTAPPTAVRSASDEIQVTPKASNPSREEAKTSSEARALWAVAQDVLDRRCVVCHGCYDAPCQLKLDSYEGLARGATEARVYDASRLAAADPTRIFVDASGIEAWRDKGFHSVLAEGGDARDPRESVLYRMLALKHEHPMPPSGEVQKHFTFELNRKESCARAGSFDQFAKEHPLWGMPYAMPALSDEERKALTDWLDAGAPSAGERALARPFVREIERWETFLNQPSAKAKLAARYLFEHLFLASLYFPELDQTTHGTAPALRGGASFFRLVRSRTPTGTAVQEIPTRRPFDDPGEGALYYRFVRRLGTPLAKTHMPYALDAARMRRYRELFFDADYQVSALPPYAREVAANPFKAFAAIPAKARYRFLLDDAQFILMNFIKGPVCRGQIALNVIQERFWIAFIDPDVEWVESGSSMLASDDANMPAEEGSNAWPTAWLQYQTEHAHYVNEKSAALRALAKDGKAGFSLDVIWDGDGKNANAALTVLRHFDSASVIQGWVGAAPKTAWVMDFPVLERIHYLLAAGFDVFGNVSHQVMTRLYMDFLRMEAERNFLMFLPPADRRALVDAWYRGLDQGEKNGEEKKRVYQELDDSLLPAGVRYQTSDRKQELLEMLAKKLEPVRSMQHELSEIDDAGVTAAARELARLHGVAASRWPEVTFIALREGEHDPKLHLTVLRNTAHTNVADLLGESKRLLPKEDGLTVLRGLVSAYPNALLEVERSQLSNLVAQAKRLAQDPKRLHGFRASFALERTSPSFWERVDRMHQASFQADPIGAGLFDLSRIDPPMQEP